MHQQYWCNSCQPLLKIYFKRIYGYDMRLATDTAFAVTEKK